MVKVTIPLSPTFRLVGLRSVDVLPSLLLNVRSDTLTIDLALLPGPCRTIIERTVPGDHVVVILMEEDGRSRSALVGPAESKVEGLLRPVVVLYGSKFKRTTFCNTEAEYIA